LNAMPDLPTRHLRAVFVSILLALPFPGACAEMQKLQVGEITISYPAGYESQAKELAKAADEVIPKYREQFMQVERALSDAKGIAKRITDLLGCPKCAEIPTAVISAFQPVMPRLSGVFTDLRLYSECDLMKPGGFKEGPVRITYDPGTREFSSFLELESGAAGSDKAFMAFAVRSDGTIRSRGQPLRDFLSGWYGNPPLMALAPLHEAAEGILVKDLGFNHAFGRWFNEGVATWVMLRVCDQLLPSSLSKEVRKKNLPGEKGKAVRGKVNLLTWPQSDLEPARFSAEELEIGDACYPCATEAVDRMLKDKADALPKILAKLKGSRSPDTDKLCAVITEVTGRDAKKILLEYVPDEVRVGIEKGEPESLRKDAREKLRAGVYTGAVVLLSRALKMTPPDFNACLNMAWGLRKCGFGGPTSEQMIRIAAWELDTAKDKRVEVGFDRSDTEARYVIGRVLQLAGDTERAKAEFEQVLKTDPNHADARAAMKELEQ